MNARPANLAAIALIIAVGFSIGAWLAIRGRGPQGDVQRVTVATSARTPVSDRTVGPAPKPAPAVTAIIHAAARSTVSAAATVTPVVTLVTTPAPPTPAAPPAKTNNAASDSVQGSWQLDEANVQVGTILWAGDAQLSQGGDTVVFNVHKQSVGGRPAAPCERETALRATFSLGVADQTVPYREVNCAGVVSTGEVRVTGFSPNGQSFSGSFWSNGTNLGQFGAHKL
jgi:hypothetical protein